MFLPADETPAFEWFGLSISDRTAGLALSSSLATIDVPPGVGHPRAWSDRSDKYYVVIEGRVRFEISGHRAELTVGDACVVPRGERFEYENAGETAAHLVLVHTPPFDPEAEHFEES